MKTHDTDRCCTLWQMISIQQSTIYSNPDSVFEDVMFSVVDNWFDNNFYYFRLYYVISLEINLEPTCNNHNMHVYHTYIYAWNR